MTTAEDIISSAFRESQLLDLGVAPSDNEEAEALKLLRGVVSRRIRPPVLTIWLGDVSSIREQRGPTLRNFTPFVDRLAAPQDVYLNCIMDQAYTLKLPPSPGDGSRFVVIDVGQNFGTYNLTLEGNGNLIDGGTSYTLSDSGQGVSLMFRRDIAQWIIIPATLQASNNIPFPEEFDALFSIELALRLNPRYGATMDEITVEVYKDVKSRFVSRYMSTNSSADPDILWGSNGRWSGDRGGFY